MNQSGWKHMPAGSKSKIETAQKTMTRLNEEGSDLVSLSQGSLERGKS